MGVLSRVTRLVKANLNEMIDKAEDPEKTLKQCIREMQEGLSETREKVTEAIAARKILARKASKEGAEARKWEERAVLALRKENEGLAREAVLKKRGHEAASEALTLEEGRQDETVQILKTALEALEAKLEEAKRKRDILIARSRQARARKDIVEELEGVAAVGGKADTSAFEAFAQVEDRVLALEAEAETRAEMGKLGGAGEPTAERKFEEMETEEYVTRELERLRAVARSSG